MERFKSQNLHLPTSDDLNSMQEFKADAVRRRITDTRSWGILHANAYPTILDIPASAVNPAPNLLQAIGEFTINFDTQLGRLDVGLGSNSSLNPKVVGGVAYDLNGERISIPDDVAFDFSNDIPEGKKSSGNLQIPLTVSGTTGGPSTNPSVLGTYYLWIEYLEINDATFQEVARDGTIFWPKILDGYKIVLSTSPVAPSGDGLSVFLAKIVWAVAFPAVLTVTAGSSTQTNGNSISTVPADVIGEPKRIYSLVRDNQVEIVIDTDNPTEVYAPGQRLTLRDHILGIGSTAPTPTNVHGLTIENIPGGTAEPKATQNQLNSLAKGIVDLSLDVNGAYVVPQNSPASLSGALRPTIEQSTLTPANLDATTIVGSGISSSSKDAWVRIGQLEANQVVYVSGNKLSAVYPTLLQTTDHTGDPASGDGWVGFDNTETVGTYRIFGSIASLSGTDILLLRKEILPAFPALTPELAVGFLLIGMVYWDGSSLYGDLVKTTGSQAIDLRSLGLVGPMQISTEAKNEADKGILARHVPNNLVLNSNYLINVAGAPTDVTYGNVGVAPAIITTPATISGATDPKLLSQVGAISGLRFSTNAAQTGSSHIYNRIPYLKPSSLYSISFWYRVESAFNARMKVGLSDGAGVSPTSYLTVEPVDMLLRNDSDYHRVSVIVQTLSTVDPSTATPYLELRFDNGGGVLTSAQVNITNVQVTEGEWTVGYSGGPGSSGGSQATNYDAPGLPVTLVTNSDAVFEADILPLFTIYSSGQNFLISATAGGVHNWVTSGGSSIFRTTDKLLLDIDGVLDSYHQSASGMTSVIIPGFNSPVAHSLTSARYLAPGAHTMRLYVQTQRITPTGSIDLENHVINTARLSILSVGA